MQKFIDTITNQPWQFDDTDDVREVNGVWQVFGRNGKRLMVVPETLTPQPDGWEPPEPPARPFEELQAEAVARLNASFQTAAAAVTAGYPDIERLTWPTQQAEVQAWFLDNNAATPYLDGLAAERGIDRQDMIIKTWEQTQLFMAASQMLVGKLQRLRDLVYEAKSVSDLEAVTWDE